MTKDSEVEPLVEKHSDAMSAKSEDGPSKAHPLLAAFYCAFNIIVAGAGVRAAGTYAPLHMGA